MVEFFVIRHGKTEYNEKSKIIGELPIPLTESGTKKLDSFTEFFNKNRIDKVYSSDYVRAKQTAEKIVDNLSYSIPIEFTKELQEVNYGLLSGKVKTNVREKYPRYHSDVLFNNPAGESFHDMDNRIIRFIEKIRFQKGKYLLVTHAGCIRSIISFFRDEDLANNINMKVSHSEVLVCNFRKKKDIQIIQI